MRTTFIPPAVEPAQEPINIARSKRIWEAAGQRLKSKVTKPVVEIMEESWKELYRRELLCRDINWMSIPGMEKGEHIRCTVKIRYRHGGQPAAIEMTDNGLVRVTFDDPVRAATPGQSAVFYDKEDRVIGGGIITEVL